MNWHKSCELAGVIFELVGKATGLGTDMAKEILKSGKFEKMKQ